MASTSRYVKLGLFTVLVSALAIGAAVWLGVLGTRRSVSYYHCFFDNSVQGLDIGAAVKFRGVTVGAVENVGVASDARHIDVLLSIDNAHARSLKPSAPNSPLRARAVMLGITGVKIIDFDVVDPKTSPPPKLPFTTPPNTIATAPSTLEGLEQNLGQLGEQLPALIEQMTSAVSSLGLVVDEVRDQKVVDKLNHALEQAGGAAAELNQIAKALGDARLPENIARGLDGLNGAFDRVNHVLEQVGGDGGLVASAQRATNAFGDLGSSTAASTERLDSTLRDVDEAARAIRDLALELQAQPDILVKGRARPRR